MEMGEDHLNIGWKRAALDLRLAMLGATMDLDSAGKEDF